MWSTIETCSLQGVGQRVHTPKTHQGPGLPPEIVHLFDLSDGLFLLHTKVVDSYNGK
jgi:hypothetical protein